MKRTFKESIQATAVKQALKYVNKDPEENIPRIIKWVERYDTKGTITVSALWEFAEYGSDMLLGTDSQNDTYINGIHSYFLGKTAGQLGSIDGISQVVVNGMELPGYVDIGLIDTMGDMLIETLGASLGCGLLAADQGKHPTVRRRNDLQ